MSFFTQLLLSLLFLSYSLLPLISSANSITLPLFRVAPPSLITNTKPWEDLKYQANVSRERAQHLKHPNDVVHTQLYPRGYGGYSVLLSFGTPPQALKLSMDTGSSLSWFPCTQGYICTKCNFQGMDPANITLFIPSSSSSYEPLPCSSPQCKWLFSDSHCIKNNQLCGYIYQYGTGNTTGMLVSETLTFQLPELAVDDFTVGCSVSSAYEPEGIVGFGRAPESLPSQMGLTSFSYCLVSHDLDDNPSASSDLVLTTTNTTTTKYIKGGKVHYTSFANNPDVPSIPAFMDFYYVKIQNIFVGGVNVRVPAQYLESDSKGHGGTVVDSGSTLTQMDKGVFDLVFNEFQKQVGNKYKRATNIENEVGLGLCYNVSRGRGAGKNKNIKLPQLTFSFVGGTKMVLPLPNYFTYVGKNKSILCMTIVNIGGDDGIVGLGPTIYIGNYLQQNYYMEYDLENNRLGILQKTCKLSKIK